jgi:hypothetical protein
MNTTNRERKRVYVSLQNPESPKGNSEHVTLYGVAVAEVLAKLLESFPDNLNKFNQSS